MPIFEYLCNQCGHRFEQITSSDISPECPTCGKRNTEKLLSSFAVGRSNGSGALPKMTAGPCGSCGDPRGPGACKLNRDWD